MPPVAAAFWQYRRRRASPAARLGAGLRNWATARTRRNPPDLREFPGRIRRAGSGRRPKTITEPGLLEALAELVQSATRGDAEAALLWVSRSQRCLARALAERGFSASQKLVGRLLRRLGFSLQANSKTRTGTHDPDRNAQFEFINAQVQAFQAVGQPAISVDTKKELVGDFKNAGRELRLKGCPEPVRVHDFALPELGKVAPYGVYDIATNTGWANLGITSDTATFAVESIRRWWHELGQARYPDAKRLQRNPKDLRVITADCGGSNGVRAQLWKTELQRLADQTGLLITVAHLPPGTSRWNRVEHRLFAFNTQNWRGKPLLTHQVIVQLIASTTTQTGLTVQCRLGGNAYEKGTKVSDAKIASLGITPADFHGEWNYTIAPRKPDT